MSAADESRDKNLSLIHIGFAVLAAGIAIIAMVGWGFNKPVLTSVANGRPSLSIMTAVVMLVGVIAVLAAPFKGAISWLFGVIVAIGGVAIVAFQLTAIPEATRLPQEWWSSPLTGLMFIATGASSAMIGRRFFVKGQVVAFGLMLVALLLAFGHLAPHSVLYQYLPGTGVSIPTIVCFFSLAVSGLLACRHRGIAASLSSTGAAGGSGLKMLGVGTVCVLISNFSVLESFRAKVVDAETAIMVVSWVAIAALGASLWNLAIAADRAEKAKSLANLETDRLRQTFIAALTHDLRGPLHTASLAASMLSKIVDDPRAAGSLVRLQRSHKRLDRMLKASLDNLSGVTGEGMVLNRDHVDLRTLVEEVASENSVVFDGCVKISGQASGKWDAELLFRLVENLLLNAKKYGDAQQIIECGIEGNASRASLMVHNFGTPIPTSEWDEIFKPFSRGKNRQGKDGWGVGLAFCRAVAEKHGGKLEILKSDTSGTVFQLILPAE